MEDFGLTMCVVLLIAIQHVSNWGIRRLIDCNEDAIAAVVFIVTIIVSLWIIKALHNYYTI